MSWVLDCESVVSAGPMCYHIYRTEEKDYYAEQRLILPKKNMKPILKHMIGLGLVAVWAVLSYVSLGVEDGSSGLSPLDKG